MSEHGKTSLDSEIVRHRFEYPGHEFNLYEPNIVAFEHHIMKRKIKEPLFIQQRNPTLNKQEKSYNLMYL